MSSLPSCLSLPSTVTVLPSPPRSLKRSSSRATPRPSRYHLYPFTTAAGTDREGGYAFGHSGVGGSVALCDPQHGLSVAITVNHLVSNRTVAKRVMRCVAHELKLGGTYSDFE